MIVSCPSCSTRYKMDPTTFGPEGRRVRCTKCAHVWTQMPAEDLPRAILPELVAEPAPDAGATAPVTADAATGSGAAARAAARRRFEESRMRADTQGRGGRAGWLVLALVVVSLATAAVLAREAVVRAWPPAERLYTILGLEGERPGAGLAIKVTEHRQDVEGRTPVLIVKGEVTNTSDAVRDVPRLKASLRTERGHEVAGWSFATAQARLLPGEAAPFITRIENPAKDGTVLNIDFAAGGR